MAKRPKHEICSTRACARNGLNVQGPEEFKQVELLIAHDITEQMRDAPKESCPKTSATQACRHSGFSAKSEKLGCCSQ